MNSQLLHKEVQQFIVEQSDQAIDINKLILKGSPFTDIAIRELAQQISGRLRIKHKLPSWYGRKNIYYPPTLHLEQTSSEITAFYKSQLVSGDTLIDITGGFGIDDYFFAKRMKHVIHCEINASLSKIASYNFETMDIANIQTVDGDGLEVLNTFTKVDWIYIDPSRRHDSKGKVFFLEDCLPNVPENIDSFFERSTNVLIKTSPLLDLKTGINALKYVKEIHIIAVKNEVKELLWVLEKEFEGHTIVKTINFSRNHTHSQSEAQTKKLKRDHIFNKNLDIFKAQFENAQRFNFILKEEALQSPKLGIPKSFLYEPNAAILKSGGFLSVGHHHALEKLHLHSHLYTSNKREDFPGRIFEIIAILPFQKKIIAKAGFHKANVTIRNFPESVSKLRKKLKIKEGGDNYLFFTTDVNNKKIVIHCKKAI
ncbi:class I SAM-dependent methyltransferase [Aquimarina sp. U1-2]|uniref:class I SAM-dependent methyltransferase n=1 Tax=Aquimarina sp. U1-2 TaxID=2823141 RepID=UPI001AECA86E|nr:class I SAM-dependent methyltransferase [Aquimarina sp. U1-2]MBP2832132.1 class I SAM-dependent methyltransferase [Aquimarina sp. U1-2]